MNCQNIILDEKDGILQITINRPGSLNALNYETLSEIKSAFIEYEERVRVLLLTGSGEKAFVAGADIKGMVEFTPTKARKFAEVGRNLLTIFNNSNVVTIALVNGFALGGGCELALGCDLIYASENAKFSQPEINLGIMPGFGGTQRLPRLVGRNKAKELLFLGDMIDAREAHRIGLINGILSKEELLNGGYKIAERIRNKPKLAIAAIKKAINNGIHLDVERGCELEIGYFCSLFDTEDQKEGMRAFIEKREPKFI